MSETPQKVSSTYVASGSRRNDDPTGWVGWIIYAGVMMILLGCFAAIQGLVALFDDDYFLVGKNGLVVHMSYTSWGWIHLIFGALAVVGGIALMAGRMWARVYAVVLAMLNAVVELVYLQANPIWSVMMITIDALVIWAVCVHGREVRQLD